MTKSIPMFSVYEVLYDSYNDEGKLVHFDCREQFYAKSKDDAELMFDVLKNQSLVYFVHSVRLVE